MAQIGWGEAKSQRAFLADDHWWSMGMRQISLQFVRTSPVRSGLILELGSGRGAFLHEVADVSSDNACIGIDIWASALTAARSYYPNENLALANLLELPLPASVCAAVFAFDVFDQSGVELDLALRETWRVLRPGGILLLRVSAYEWLFGPHDELFGTGQRYSRRQLIAALNKTGFRLQRMTYANTLLLPPTILLRLMQQRDLLPVRWELTPPGWLNQTLRLPLAIERRWLRRHDLPAGLSIFVLAKKAG
ncbi:MAG: methyltransferase domain-containing protein [Caldilineales bacterium]|nr:methyltransferase domain-containing protein [Caldilineales bacterium]